MTGIVLFMERKVCYVVRRAPQILSELGLLLGLQDVVCCIDDVSKEVLDAIDEDSALEAVDTQPEEKGAPVRCQACSTPLSLAANFAAKVLLVIGAVFFFLLSRHELYQWISRRRDGTYRGPTARTPMEAVMRSGQRS